MTAVSSTGAAHRSTSSLVSALRYEWIRLVSMRSTWGLAGSSLVAALMVCWGFSLVLSDQELAVTEVEAALVLITRSPLTLLVPAILGTLAATSDHRYGLALVTQSVLPRRRRAPVVRAAVVAVFAGGLVLVAVLAAAGLAVVLVGSGVDLLEAFPQLAVFVGLGAGWAAIGVAVGTIVRSQGSSIALLVLWPFTIEPLVRLLLGSARSRFVDRLTSLLPASAGEAAIRPDTPLEGSLLPGGPTLPSPWLGAIAFVAFVCAALLAAAFSNDRRDAMG